MYKISINLLPPELALAQKGQDKFRLLQRLGIGVVMLLLFLASVAVSLRIFQTGQMGKIKSEIAIQEERVNGLKTKEASLAVLKNRVSLISEIVKTSTDQSDLYTEFIGRVPPGVNLSAFTLSGDGNILMAASMPNHQALSALIGHLTIGSGAFRKVTIESLSRSKGGEYRASLSIQTR